MKKTKIDWCDCTINPVVGCQNGCKYCYAEKINCRFHIVKNWKCPEFFPERLAQFYSKKPKSVFIDSMSDIGTWQQSWFNTVIEAINDNPQHKYIALTKRYSDYIRLVNRANVGVTTNLWIGTSITTQEQANKHIELSRIPDFYSIEPILEPIDIPEYYMPRTLIIGAETGNHKGKVIPQKEWVMSLVKQADKHNTIVFMKESLRTLMGENFRQDTLLWKEIYDE